jgi:hypothetical protein
MINSVLTFLRLKNNKLWTTENSNYNQIQAKTEELNIPQHLMNNVSKTTCPSFNIVAIEKAVKDNPQKDSPKNWIIALNYHKKGIITSYCNPLSNISEENLLSNCKNYATALKFVLNRIIPLIKDCGDDKETSRNEKTRQTYSNANTTRTCSSIDVGKWSKKKRKP